MGQMKICFECGSSYEEIKEPVYCNLCAKELDEWDAQEKLIIHTVVGYGSSHDGDAICLQFCCECFDKIVDDCKISPIVGSGNWI